MFYFEKYLHVRDIHTMVWIISRIICVDFCLGFGFGGVCNTGHAKYVFLVCIEMWF